jgi:hypothetical protein
LTEDKLLAVLRGSDGEPVTELLCGTVARGDRRTTWGREGEKHACP